MKSKIRKSEYQAIYRLLDKVSPLDFDCGVLCGSVCCGADESGWLDDDGHELDMGIYLLPGEEKIHDKKEDWLTWKSEPAEDYEFPESWKGNVYFVRCTTPPRCPREKRPIQCRTFPLAPHFTADGRLAMVLNDLDLPYICPLIEESGALNDDFIKATWTCWSHLIKDPLIRDLVEMDSDERREACNGEEPDIIYAP